MQHAVIVGGGIGGLAAGAGLHRLGWRVTVLEQSDTLGGVGAGLMLWPNALRALETLGFADQVESLGQRQHSGELQNHAGRRLAWFQASRIEALLGRPMLGVHRADLHAILAAALPDDALRTGVRVGGEMPRADLIIGADGINSSVRAAIHPEAPSPAYSGLTAWRGVCDPVDSGPAARGVLEIGWGRGQEVGVVPLVDGRLYWYATQRAPRGQQNDDERAYIRRHFAWHDAIAQAVEATPASAVLRHDLYSLPALPGYCAGRVALLGDAAHAMMPGLGQGACQALEDAAVLVDACAREGAVPAALRRYDAERRPRSQWVARASWRALQHGSMLENPLVVAARDLAVGLVPAPMMLRGMTSVSRWQPPRPSVVPTDSP